MNAIIARIKAEPAVVIGGIATAIVFIAQQALDAGIVSSTGNVNLLNTVIAVTPLVAGWIIRNFVSPVA